MDNFVINANDVVAVQVPEPEVFAVVTVLGPQGIQGVQGEIGPTYSTVSEIVGPGDGVTDSFPLTYAARSGTHQVFRNGLAELPGIGFTATESSITLSVAPIETDVVFVSYQVLQED